jgi:DNA-binding FadR family transcriptional regulator
MGHGTSAVSERHDSPVVTRDRLFGAAREAAYAPIVGQSLVVLTARRLSSTVSLGLLEVGQQLPPEPELAERLGVSAATLREALAMLRSMGVLRTRRGRGGGSVVVGEIPQPSAAEARRQLAAWSFDDLRDLGGFHAAVAGRAAMLAANQATSAEAELLGALVREMRDGGRSIARLDAQFHIGLASAAQSIRLTSAETSLQAELAEFTALLVDSPGRRRTALAEHEEIVAAVAERDANRARQAAERHVETGTSWLLDARSGLSSAESGGVELFAGLRPFGSELGAPHEITRPDRAARRDRSGRP